MNKINPFEGKAIKFDTSEQLDHLAELARGYGLVVCNVVDMYPCTHFRDSCIGYYSNCEGTNGLPEIHYSDFVASIEAVKSNHSEQQPELIARPSHYRKCSIEPIQIWRQLSLNGFMGDALKYLMRLGHKDDKVKELTKCIQYLTWEIENIQLGILQFTPKDAKCSVPADVIAKELGMSPFIHVALHVVLNLQNIEHKIPALQTGINCIRLEIINIEVSN